MAEHDTIFIKNSTTVDANKLESLLRQFGSARYELNGNSIRDDISKLETRAKETKNKIYAEGCHEIIKYLNTLLKVADKTLNGSVKVSGHSFVEQPVILRRFPQFLVQAVDSLNVDSIDSLDAIEGIIHVNIDHILDAIAVEVSKFDLDYTIEDIEKEFSDCGIVETCNGDRVIELGKNSCIYREPGDIFLNCCGMLIEKSEYSSLSNNGRAYSYFGTEVKDKKRYEASLVKSAEELMRILVVSELGRIREKKLNDIRLISVSNGLITYGVGSQYRDSIDNVVNILTETIVIKLMGRKFSFKPTISTISVQSKEEE